MLPWGLRTWIQNGPRFSSWAILFFPSAIYLPTNLEKLNNWVQPELKFFWWIDQRERRGQGELRAVAKEWLQWKNMCCISTSKRKLKDGEKMVVEWGSHWVWKPGKWADRASDVFLTISAQKGHTSLLPSSIILEARWLGNSFPGSWGRGLPLLWSRSAYVWWTIGPLCLIAHGGSCFQDFVCILLGTIPGPGLSLFAFFLPHLSVLSSHDQ